MGRKTLRELFASPEIAGLGWAKIQQALAILVGAGHLQPSLSAKDEGKRAKSTKAFNQAVIARARDHGDLQFMASPVSGGGHSIGRFHQLFLMSSLEGGKTPSDWAAFTWQLIAAQGQRLIKGGQDARYGRRESGRTEGTGGRVRREALAGPANPTDCVSSGSHRSP